MTANFLRAVAFATVLESFCATIGITPSFAESLGFSLASTGSARVTVSVLEDQTLQPIGGASIVITDGTNEKTKTITVSKEGYAGITLVGVQADQITVYLKALPKSANPAIISGLMTGWQTRARTRGDSVMAGLVIKTLSAMDLLHFELDSFISPLRDTISVFGERKIPSNLTLPEQDIYVLFGSIHVDKPTYRLPLRANQSVRLAAVQGEMDVNDILPAFQGGKMSLTLLNKLHFSRAGLTESFTAQDGLKKNVTTTQTLTPKFQVQVTQPPFVSDVLAASVTDIHGDRQVLMPVDVKLAVNSDNPNTINHVTLASPTQRASSSAVVTLAIGKKGRRLSGIVTAQPGRIVRPGGYLPTRDYADTRSLPDAIDIQAPSFGLGAAVFEALDSPESRTSHAVWYVYSFPAAGAYSIPTRALPNRDQIESYSVHQLEFDETFNEGAFDGLNVMQKLRRFSRSSAHVAESKYDSEYNDED